jgi:hypothetical protein
MSAIRGHQTDGLFRKPEQSVRLLDFTPSTRHDGALGMPGCTLLVAPEVNVLATGDWTLRIPDVIDFAGTWLFHQAFVVDPGFNSAQVVASNGWFSQLGV